MDLIYTNVNRVDLGVLSSHDFDLSFGASENDFELTLGADEPALEFGSFVYIEGTEYGGIVDGIEASTNGETITYKGRTWHGMINSKVIQPNAGEAYYVVSGDANSVLDALITRLGLSGLFVADETSEEKNYQIITYQKTDTSKLSENFKVSEFACKGEGCCTTVLIDEKLVEYCQRIRDHFGKAVIINSGYRCATHNKEVGATSDSLHTKGQAADIKVTDVAPAEVAKYAESIGILGIGLYETDSDGYFVHIDTRTSKAFWYGQKQEYRSTFGGANTTKTVTNSGVTISEYRFPRYCKAYDGIRAMLASNGAKLSISCKNREIHLSAVPIADYTEAPVDGDIATLSVKKYAKKVNHMICLGKGELESREVIHLYCDQFGRIGDVQYFFGLDEITDTYENTNAESSEELRNGGISRMKELRNGDKAEIHVQETARVYDIGDIVGANERASGISVAAAVSQKIVKINNGAVHIEYKTEG